MFSLVINFGINLGLAPSFLNSMALDYLSQMYVGLCNLFWLVIMSHVHRSLSVIVGIANDSAQVFNTLLGCSYCMILCTQCKAKKSVCECIHTNYVYCAFLLLGVCVPLRILFIHDAP